VLAQRDPETALRIVAAAWAVRARNGGEWVPFYRAFAERIRAAAAEKVATDADRLWKNRGGGCTSRYVPSRHTCVTC
jgi:hypothetical protein